MRRCSHILLREVCISLRRCADIIPSRLLKRVVASLYSKVFSKIVSACALDNSEFFQLCGGWVHLRVRFDWDSPAPDRGGVATYGSPIPCSPCLNYALRLALAWVLLASRCLLSLLFSLVRSPVLLSLVSCLISCVSLGACQTTFPTWHHSSNSIKVASHTNRLITH